MATDFILKARKAFNGFTSPLAFRGLMQGIGAAVEHGPVLDWIHAGTIIDIGANRGQFALAARTRKPSPRILAFEPLAAPAAAFARLFAGDAQVGLTQLALGTEDATMDMTVTADDDSSSLLPIGTLQAELFASRKTALTSVQVRALDDVLAGQTFDGPVLIKIDVQGYELHVLKGAVNTLGVADFVYVELSFLPLYAGQPLAGEVVAFLASHGFVLRGLFNQRWSPAHGAIQADVLFAKADTR